MPCAADVEAFLGAGAEGGEGGGQEGEGDVWVAAVVGDVVRVVWTVTDMLPWLPSWVMKKSRRPKRDRCYGGGHTAEMVVDDEKVVLWQRML